MADPIEPHPKSVVTREDALAAGLRRFFTGLACRNGHLVERRVSTGHCIACLSAAKNKFADKNGRRFRRNHGEPERKAAKAAGVIRYSTGVPCQNGHLAERYTSTGKCVVCDVDRMRRWVKRNPGYEARQQRQIRARNPVPHQQSVKRWRADNPDRAREIGRASGITRRAKKAQNGGRITAAEIAVIFARQRGRCAECGKKRKLEADHIVPIEKGGSSHPHNIQGLCLPCNRRKSSKHPIEWVALNGRLL